MLQLESLYSQIQRRTKFGPIGPNFCLIMRQGRQRDTDLAFNLDVDQDNFVEFVDCGGTQRWDRALVELPDGVRAPVAMFRTEAGVEFHIRNGEHLVTVVGQRTCKGHTAIEEGLFQAVTLLARALRAANQETQEELVPLGQTPFCLLAAWSAASRVVRPKLGQGVLVPRQKGLMLAPMGPSNHRTADGRFGTALLKRTETGWVVEGSYVPLKPAKDGKTLPPFFASIDAATKYDIGAWLALITDGYGVPSSNMFSFWTDHLGRLEAGNINPPDVARAVRKVAKPLVKNGRRMELGGRGEEFAPAEWVADQIRNALDYHLNKEGGLFVC